MVSDACCIVHCDKGEAQGDCKQGARQTEFEAHSSRHRLRMKRQ